MLHIAMLQGDKATNRDKKTMLLVVQERAKKQHALMGLRQSKIYSKGHPGDPQVLARAIGGTKEQPRSNLQRKLTKMPSLFPPLGRTRRLGAAPSRKASQDSSSTSQTGVSGRVSANSFSSDDATEQEITMIMTRNGLRPFVLVSPGQGLLHRDTLPSFSFSSRPSNNTATLTNVVRIIIMCITPDGRTGISDVPLINVRKADHSDKQWGEAQFAFDNGMGMIRDVRQGWKNRNSSWNKRQVVPVPHGVVRAAEAGGRPQEREFVLLFTHQVEGVAHHETANDRSTAQRGLRPVYQNIWVAWVARNGLDDTQGRQGGAGPGKYNETGYLDFPFDMVTNEGFKRDCIDLARQNFWKESERLPRPWEQV